MGSLRRKFSKIRHDDIQIEHHLQLMFLKRLYRLLSNGYSLIYALDVIAWDDRLKRIANTMKDALLQGKFIDEAFLALKFHKLIVVYLYFVRINGDLITSIEKVILLFEQRLRTLKKLKQVTRYPFMLFIVFFILLLFIKASVLPSYAEMFQSYANSTQTIYIIIYFVNFIIMLFIMIVLCSLLIVAFWKMYERNMSIEKRLTIYEKVPILNRFTKWQTSFYFATHVSVLLKTGMAMNDILKFMENQNELPIIAYYASLMRHHLQNGYFLDELLATLPFIDSQLTIVFQRSNEREHLEKDLSTYAEMIFENMEQKMISFITYIQPTILIVLGAFIIFIYLSLLMPMFQLINSV